MEPNQTIQSSTGYVEMLVCQGQVIKNPTLVERKNGGFDFNMELTCFQIDASIERETETADQL